MSSGPIRALWALAALLVVVCAWRLARLPDPSQPAASLGTLEDRREHRFRDLGFGETQRLLEALLRRAEATPEPRARALLLARLAALQRERGLDESAQAAAREALRLAGSDPEVQRLLQAPLDLRDLRPAGAGR
jgi:hypothetical protein